MAEEKEKKQKERDPEAAARAKAKAEAAKKAAAAKPSAPAMAVSDGKETPHPTPRLKKAYAESVVPALMERHGLTNPFEVPRLEKIVVNIGVSEARENIQHLDGAREELALITGQLPQVRRAQKSISNFKLRQGMPIAVRVTLRGHRMWEFLDRLISTAIPRIRDFRGLEPKGFDGHGNFNLGLREQLIFPEISAERVSQPRGMNITFVTNAASDELSLDLLRTLGMPFKHKAEQKTAAGVN